MITHRPALAQAASYKRLAWEPNVAKIYTDYENKFGADQVIEQELKSANLSNTIKATLLWRMIYSSALQALELDNVHLVSSKTLEDAKAQRLLYLTISEQLGLENSDLIARYLTKNSKNKASQPKGTHDFARSVEFTNTYWNDILSNEEVDNIVEITKSIEDKISQL